MVVGYKSNGQCSATHVQVTEIYKCNFTNAILTLGMTIINRYNFVVSFIADYRIFCHRIIAVSY